MLVRFFNVGRTKRSFTAEIARLESAVLFRAFQRQGFTTKVVDFDYDAEKNLGTITAGFSSQPMGLFEVIKSEEQKGDYE